MTIGQHKPLYGFAGLTIGRRSQGNHFRHARPAAEAR